MHEQGQVSRKEYLLLVKRVDQHERVLFGYKDELTNLWVDGLLQTSADVRGSVRWGLWALVALVFIGLTNLSHNFGWLTVLGKVFEVVH